MRIMLCRLLNLITSFRKPRILSSKFFSPCAPHINNGPIIFYSMDRGREVMMVEWKAFRIPRCYQLYSVLFNLIKRYCAFVQTSWFHIDRVSTYLSTHLFMAVPSDFSSFRIRLWKVQEQCQCRQSGLTIAIMTLCKLSLWESDLGRGRE